MRQGFILDRNDAALWIACVVLGVVLVVFVAKRLITMHKLEDEAKRGISQGEKNDIEHNDFVHNDVCAPVQATVRSPETTNVIVERQPHTVSTEADWQATVARVSGCPHPRLFQLTPAASARVQVMYFHGNLRFDTLEQHDAFLAPVSARPTLCL